MCQISGSENSHHIFREQAAGHTFCLIVCGLYSLLESLKKKNIFSLFLIFIFSIASKKI